MKRLSAPGIVRAPIPSPISHAGMPTYEFRCPNGHTFEQFHKISDAPSTAICPTCGAEAERAISGGAGLVF